MVFSSLVFLLRFLPLTVLLYMLAPNIKVKNIVLLIASLIFYAWGEPVWVILLILSAFVDYICGRMAGKYQNSLRGRVYLITSIIINFGLLAVFKYGNFFIVNVNSLFNLHIVKADISLPIGISFYTMQTATYTIDAYLGKAKVQKSFWNFLLFVSLFPQLVAGPIVRYLDVEHQLSERKSTTDGVYTGITRFVQGLAKKTIIANYAGSLAIKYLEGNLLSQSAPLLWFGLLCYSFQIYYDFSGYSDMAIGLGTMFGFSFPENFKHPYVSQSITEFWRRWHISLSTFFRDYVYIPLGGNRRHQYFNIIFVWMLTGLWHGASWNFVLWGLYFAVILCIEKLFLLKALEKVPRFVRRLYAFTLVVFGFNFFYFENFARNIQALKVMFGLAGTTFVSLDILHIIVNYMPLVALCFILAAPTKEYILSRIKGFNIPEGIFAAGTACCIAVIIILSTASIISSSYNPFIYFRF